MQSVDNSAYRHDLPVSQQTMAAILLVVMLLSPMFIVFTVYIGGSTLSIYAPTWILALGSYSYFYINPIMLLSNFPLYGLKVIFIYFVHKCYSVEKTRKTTIRVGILSELLPFLFMMAPTIIMVLFYPCGTNFAFIPVPIVLLLGYLVLRTWPPPATPTWIESDNEQMWWEKEETEEITEPEQEDVWP